MFCNAKVTQKNQTTLNTCNDICIVLTLRFLNDEAKNDQQVRILVV